MRSTGVIKFGSYGVSGRFSSISNVIAGSTLLLGAWKMMYLVLLVFSDILLDWNQSASLCSSVRIRAIKVGRSASESRPVVSSAYSIVVRSVAFGRSFMKHRKSIGPRHVP